VDLADGPLADPELAADAFQKLAELDPRDRALRTELLERLGRVGRYRAIADVRRWEITSLETLAERKRALDALLLLAESTRSTLRRSPPPCRPIARQTPPTWTRARLW
jgi:hypothetical protein